MTTNTDPLWARASGCFQAFEMLFAPARALMDQTFLRLSEARAARAFLRGLEALVRRLSLVRARELLPHLAPTRPARPPSPPRPAPDPFDLPEDPAHWPAPFAHRLARLLRPPHEPPDTLNPPRNRPCHIGCALKEALGRRAPCAPRCPNLKTRPDAERTFIAARPTALRLEAIRRVIDDPETFAHRMARSLARLLARNAGANQPLTLAPPPSLRPAHNSFLMVALKQSQALAAGPPPPLHDTS